MSKSRIIIKDRGKFDRIAAAAGETTRRRIIADGVEYGIFVELGTERREARPALVPAFETHTRNLGEALGQAIERGVSLDDVLAKVAFDIQRDWAANVPVRTGAYKNSIHVETE